MLLNSLPDITLLHHFLVVFILQLKYNKNIAQRAQNNDLRKINLTYITQSNRNDNDTLI